MNILLTGAFGNIGSSTLEELARRGHHVRCFDLDTPANRKAARRALRRCGSHVEFAPGDLRHPEEVAAAAAGQDAVVHLAFVIPTLSATGVNSEVDPERARAINVGGTRNLIDAMRAMPTPPRLIFSSSLHIYGRTQDQAPPRTVDDPLHPIEHYAKHKVECERMVRESGLTWAILRLGAALPMRLILDPGMFGVPLNNRIEFVHSRDVATAIANALEVEGVWGQTLHIGGGAQCQLYQRDLVRSVLDTVGIGMLPDRLFTRIPFPTDWLDTTASQRLLAFQQRTLQDYLDDVRHRLGIGQFFLHLLRPIIRAWLVRQSPVTGEMA